MNKNYSALTLEELPKRLSQISAITDQIGTNFSEWNVTEVGDESKFGIYGYWQ